MTRSPQSRFHDHAQRLTAWYAAGARSVLVAYLLVMTLGLPVMQLLHQGAHRHDGATAACSAMGSTTGTVAPATRASGDDEATCQICQLLKTRIHAALIADEPLVVSSADLEAIFHAPPSQGIVPARPGLRFARGPPRVS